MNVEVAHRLPAIFPLIKHKPVSIHQALLFGDNFRRVQEVRVITMLWNRCGPLNLSSSHKNDVDGSNGRNVPKRDDMLIFVNDVARNLAVDDLCKEGRHDSF